MEARSYEVIPWVKPKVDIFHPIPIKPKKHRTSGVLLNEPDLETPVETEKPERKLNLMDKIKDMTS